MTDIPRITLDEQPHAWRCLCDDGQTLDVTGYQLDREQVLAWFEQHTTRERPAKGKLWVRIEGVAEIAPHEQEQLPL